MALTKVSGGILDPGINVAGIVTATGFDGPFTGGSSKNITAGIITATGFDLNGNGDISGNLVIGGNLTANGDFTTLNTTLREVEILRVDANTTAVAGIITQRGSGDIFSVYDTSTEVFKIADGGQATFTGDVTVGSGGENSALGVRVNSAYAQIKLPDGQTGANRKGNLSFGDNDDFRIVHDGYHNYITSGAGDIYISNTGGTAAQIFNDRVNLNVDLTLTDTTADSAAGPELKLFRNSASPADADYLGQIKFAGENDNSEEIIPLRKTSTTIGKCCQLGKAMSKLTGGMSDVYLTQSELNEDGSYDVTFPIDTFKTTGYRVVEHWRNAATCHPGPFDYPVRFQHSTTIPDIEWTPTTLPFPQHECP